MRLSVPSDLGRNTLLLWLDELLLAHPALSIDLTIGDTLADFYSDGLMQLCVMVSQKIRR
ncbi:transcriptional regulator LysR family [Vibrio astriarenae]|nr:transcriptional regulator LysR family [Vibrio sp. C7]